MRRSSPFGTYFGPTLGGVRRIPIRGAFMGQGSEKKMIPYPHPFPPPVNSEPISGSESSDGSCVYLITVKNPGMIVSTITERYIIKGFHILRVPAGIASDVPTADFPNGGPFQMYELWACEPGHTPPGYREPEGKTPIVVPPPPVTPPAEPSTESAPPSGDLADLAVAGGLLAAVTTALLVT